MWANAIAPGDHAHSDRNDTVDDPNCVSTLIAPASTFDLLTLLLLTTRALYFMSSMRGATSRQRKFFLEAIESQEPRYASVSGVRLHLSLNHSCTRDCYRTVGSIFASTCQRDPDSEQQRRFPAKAKHRRTGLTMILVVIYLDGNESKRLVQHWPIQLDALIFSGHLGWWQTAHHPPPPAFARTPLCERIHPQ
ncbi:hypothetical protein BC826DRAFT_971436 [Russula brevipes]|nr:hypothetical protein BC826DRAFT_971436 [Russula brevipes]